MVETRPKSGEEEEFPGDAGLEKTQGTDLLLRTHTRGGHFRETRKQWLVHGESRELEEEKFKEQASMEANMAELFTLRSRS